jgi:hypothetical protein
MSEWGTSQKGLARKWGSNRKIFGKVIPFWCYVIESMTNPTFLETRECKEIIRTYI